VKHWSRRGAVAWLLWPVSLVFGFFVFARRILYWVRILPSRQPGIPVIVVGNLTVGGTGKTPLVIWIAELLKSKGWSPAIVSRGYGARIETPRAATIADDAANQRIGSRLSPIRRAPATAVRFQNRCTPRLDHHWPPVDNSEPDQLTVVGNRRQLRRAD